MNKYVTVTFECDNEDQRRELMAELLKIYGFAVSEDNSNPAIYDWASGKEASR